MTDIIDELVNNKKAKPLKASQINRIKTAKEIIGGKRQVDIARERGVSKAYISQVLKSDEARSLIRREQLRLIGSVPKAVDNIMGLVDGFREFEGDEKKMAYDATKEVLRTGTIFPTPMNSQTTVTQIFNQQNIVASPVVQKFLEEHVKKLQWDGDAVEGEVVKDAVQE